MRTYVKQYRQNRIKMAFEKLGNKCAKCEVTNNLEFDHIELSKKTYNIEKILTNSLILFLNEIEKCQLLCNNCHKEKTKKENKNRIPVNKDKWKHGSLTGYMIKKCKCEECRGYYKIYKRNKRLLKKLTL